MMSESNEILDFNVLYAAVEEENIASTVLLFAMAYRAWKSIPVQRNKSLYVQRLHWEEYSALHVQRGTFKRRLRMSKHSFDKLLEMIAFRLIVSERQASKRGGAIIPELCLYCTIRYLAGGSYLDICDVAGISTSSFYRIIWKTMKILNSTRDLRIHFPTTREEIAQAMSDFASISYDMAIINCVGVVDGYLMRIRVPTKKEAGNVRSYFSGHYQCYGVNVQAVADHNSRFLYIGLAAPGVTADRDAIEQCNKLYDAIENLPFGACIIGDAAYEATEHMVPVYQGIEKLIPKFDNFNFFASQLRIRVEMAFGLLQGKWGVLQRPLQCSLKNAGVLIESLGRLHNYVINERILASDEPETAKVSERDVSKLYLGSMPTGEDGDPIDMAAMFGVTRRSGYSECRTTMVNRIAARSHLKRPYQNKIVKEKTAREVAIEGMAPSDDSGSDGDNDGDNRDSDSNKTTVAV